MDFSPKTAGFEHGPGREDWVWGGKTWLPHMVFFFFISVNFCHNFVCLAALLHTSELPQAGRTTGSYCLCPAKDPGPGLSEPALGELDALGLPLAAIQDAWWGCSRLCPGDSISVHLRLLTLSVERGQS